MPYYLKVREYTDLENRDIWEYELNLSPEEIDRLLMHAWELGPIHFDYYFFDENCAYHLLGLLEAARPDLELTKGFRWWAIPSDTVREVVKQKGLVKRDPVSPLERHGDPPSARADEPAGAGADRLLARGSRPRRTLPFTTLSRASASPSAGGEL